MMWVRLKKDLTVNLKDESKAYKKGSILKVPRWKGYPWVNQHGIAEEVHEPEPTPKKRGRPPKKKTVESPPVDKMVDKEETEDK